MSEVGFVCPQCKRNLLVDPYVEDICNTWCDDCGAELELELDYVVTRVNIMTRGKLHDDD